MPPLPTSITLLCMKVPFTKDQMGQATGRTSLALAAFTDPALALAFVQALGQPEVHAQILENLDRRTKRIQQRQKETKAHLRNKAVGHKVKKEH